MQGYRRALSAKEATWAPRHLARRTFAQVAELIGAPTAVRAVTRHHEPHRADSAVSPRGAVRTGGALAGYRWGVERKHALLEQERASAAD